MSILPKASYRLHVIHIKIPMVFFTEIEKKKKIKFVWNHKRPQTAKAIMRKNKPGTIMYPDFNYITKL